MRKSDVDVAKLVVVFMLLYLDASVLIAGIPIPSATSMLIPFVLGGLLPSLRAALPVLIAFLCVALISFLASEASAPFGKVLSSWIQTSVALYLSVVVYRWIAQTDLAVLYRAARIVFVLLAAIIFLESIGILSGASSSFGKLVYSNGVGYSYYGSGTYNELRDLSLAGFRRPTAFSSEPSIAAIGLSVAGLAMFASKRTLKVFAVVSVSLMASWYIFRSPIPPTAVIVCGGVSMSGRKMSTARMLQAIGVGLIAIVAVTFVSDRLLVANDSRTMATSSEGLRITLPLVNTISSLLRGNWLGIGPGGQYDEAFVARMNPFHVPLFGTNAILLAVFYYGPVLTVGLMYSYYRVLKKRTPWASIAPQFALFCAFVGSSLGAIETARLWGFAAILTGCAAVASARRLVNDPAQGASV